MAPYCVKVEHETKVNLVFATDIHLAAKPPGRRQGTYSEEILDKLSYVSALGHKLRGAVLCGGDFFHAKSPQSGSNTLGLIHDAMAVLQGMPTGAIYGPAGNHDISNDNMDSLPNQPLGLLIRAGAYCDVPVIFEAQDGTRVLVDSYYYEDGNVIKGKILKRSEELKKEIEDCGQPLLAYEDLPWHYAVAVVHAFNKRGGDDLMFGADYFLGWSDLQDTVYSAYLWGHDHARKGINRVGDGPYHVQLGSLARAALSSDEIDRPVSAAICSFSREGVKVMEQEVPVKPLHLAFHTASLQVEKVESREDVKEFLSELESHAKAVDSENPMEILRSLTNDTDIIATIMEVCELSDEAKVEDPDDLA